VTHYLLDTRTAFWYFEGNSKLSEKIRNLIESREDESIFVSIASVWELAIKRSLNYESSTLCSVDDFLNETLSSGFILLAIKPSHVRLIEALPFIHRDPFDRILIASAMADDMTILTADENIHKYDVKWLW
jgi:PIN domain nuclease of toxin-antitoxin system